VNNEEEEKVNEEEEKVNEEEEKVENILNVRTQLKTLDNYMNELTTDKLFPDNVNEICFQSRRFSLIKKHITANGSDDTAVFFNMDTSFFQYCNEINEKVNFDPDYKFYSGGGNVSCIYEVYFFSFDFVRLIQDGSFESKQNLDDLISDTLITNNNTKFYHLHQKDQVGLISKDCYIFPVRNDDDGDDEFLVAVYPKINHIVIYDLNRRENKVEVYSDIVERLYAYLKIFVHTASNIKCSNAWNVVVEENVFKQNKFEVDSGSFIAILCYYLAMNISPCSIQLDDIKSFQQFLLCQSINQNTISINNTSNADDEDMNNSDDSFKSSSVPF
jgi:hypothetical protein